MCAETGKPGNKRHQADQRPPFLSARQKNRQHYDNGQSRDHAKNPIRSSFIDRHFQLSRRQSPAPYDELSV
ncbi:hypothetical protein ANFP_30500 [Acidithiobacillus ferrooxidans]|nr:hypothetical protein ANFP_30500 [Acidithiobacillus ferrooxidans]